MDTLDYQTGFVPTPGTARLEYVSPTKVKLSRGWISIKNAGVWMKSFVKGDIIEEIDSKKLKPDTVYNVYLKSGEIPSLTFSQTEHVCEESYGVEIMKGTDTCIIVGKVWTNEKGLFEDSTYSRCVISWFNRKVLNICESLTEDVTFPDLDKKFQVGERKVKFLSWGDETIQVWSQVMFNFNNCACTTVEIDGKTIYTDFPPVYHGHPKWYNAATRNCMVSTCIAEEGAHSFYLGLVAKKLDKPTSYTLVASLGDMFPTGTKWGIFGIRG